MKTQSRPEYTAPHEQQEQLRDGLRFADVTLHDFLVHAQRRFLAGASVTDLLAEIDLTRVIVTRALDFVDPTVPTGDVAALLLTLTAAPVSQEVH